MKHAHSERDDDRHDHDLRKSVVWTDHADVRPTMLAALGLRDPYVADGRVITEVFEDDALPRSLRAHHETLERLGAVYKQLNAPFGRFGLSLLKASTHAMSASDPVYLSIESSITDLTLRRDLLANEIRAALDAAAFDDLPLNEHLADNWVWAAQTLVDEAGLLAR